ncbi:TIGR01777 family oxidoreductase [Bacillus tuaregi]|uniref:TIGR01777 family oxidoreductase n=1 Tax=Bacillus tuaregi TaxID=1816695 RepID=UPI0008F84762|nr:TIGR01777 family oxidoreductase [Bacillus tuaregi]
MKIVIAGGSGFIGQQLTELLCSEGHSVVILTRRKKPSIGQVSYINWLIEGAAPEKEIEQADAFINLAGVSINAGRWNQSHQEQIYDSRMTATDELLRIIEAMPKKPSVFINASAIGRYPASLDHVYTEASTDLANDFLARTVADWEKKAQKAEKYSIRTVFVRFGVVLGNRGGALPLMVLPYKLLLGGTVGSGKQWVSWIHVKDVVRSILFALEHDNVRGPVNITAPSPIRMEQFGQTIGHVLQRPHWFPVPSFIMKIVLGRKSALVLEGQQVIPEVLMKEGFEFMYPSLHVALEDLLLKQ